MKKYAMFLLMICFLVLPQTVFAQEYDDHDHDHSDSAAVHEEPASHDDDQMHAEENHTGHDDDEGHGEESQAGHDNGEEQGEESHAGHDDHEEEGIIEVSPEAMKLAGVTMARVRRDRIGKTIDLPGEVGFDEDRLVYVTPRFAGIAREARYRVGEYVNDGDVVAVIESNESLSPYSIKASISGWIIKRDVTPGEFVTEEHSIYIIADLSKVWVNLAVYPKDADRIRPGLTAHINAIGSKKQAEGIIDYVTPILDVDTRSMTARVVLPNPNNAWRPGTFVRARVVADPGEEGLVVEKSAVQVFDEEQVVFVADGPGRFKPVEVKTGDSNSHYIRILSGLELGTEYVSAGAFELKAKIVTSSLGGHAGHGH